MRFAAFLLAAITLSVAPTSQAENNAGTQPSVVPFTLLETGGSPRPIVLANINGHSIPMMIHSNAGFFAQLRHEDAANFGVSMVGGHKQYGIDQIGHVSTLGLDHGVAASLSVGGSIDHDAPINVFEIPQSNLGMLGIGWINQNRVIVDYRQKIAMIAPSTDQVRALENELKRSGYVALPMSYDDQHKRYMVEATISHVTRPMNVATATTLVIDSSFADSAAVKRGDEKEPGYGPTGTRVANYALGEPVRVQIDGWTSPPLSKGDIMDTYGYIADPRPDDPSKANGGILGGDFLTMTQAVVDFGTRTLFVRGSPSP